MVEEKKEGVWEDITIETSQDFDRGIKQMWVEQKGVLSKQAGEIDKGKVTPRARNGNVVTLGRKRIVSVDTVETRNTVTPVFKRRFDADFEIKNST